MLVAPWKKPGVFKYPFLHGHLVKSFEDSRNIHQYCLLYALACSDLHCVALRLPRQLVDFVWKILDA